MTENPIQPVSKERHASKRWQRYTHYHFAAADAIAPLVVQELPQAMMALPIGFVAVESRFVMVAVLGIAAGRNLFVAADGRWLAGYLPAAYRAYPFLLANIADDKQVLCINEGSGAVTDEPEGEAFFNDDGTLAQAVADVLNFLNQVQASREATNRICAMLQKHHLIQPWPIKLQSEQTIQGLYRIDEAALNALPADAFLELREAGALPLVYCQLLSMQHLSKLGQLAQAHAQAEAAEILKTSPSGELDLEYLTQDETIRFGHS